MDDDRGAVGVCQPLGGQATHVPAVTYGEEGEHPDCTMFDGVKGAGYGVGHDAGMVDEVGFEGVPDGPRIQCRIGNLERNAAHHLVSVSGSDLIAGHSGDDLDFTYGHGPSIEGSGPITGDDPNVLR